MFATDLKNMLSEEGDLIDRRNIPSGDRIERRNMPSPGVLKDLQEKDMNFIQTLPLLLLLSKKTFSPLSMPTTEHRGISMQTLEKK